MHLKTLSLVGFKSFADRTRVECEPGVTVVVGPNGTGKSNLVDAAAWVMGTQAASTLRTSRMEDVIFAGTSSRRALGRAEVSLTIADPGGRLGDQLADVTITRRLYRDGTSEYEINGAACRLLDIQELLADAGVGRHQHVIVGQGRVDAVLNAGPEEHRAVIEEAAGVIKHRNRRDRAIRRLEATEIDMTRLRDLLDEQRRQMRPLKRQAKAAERHDAVHAEWRQARLWLEAERLRSIRERKGTLEAEKERIQRLLSSGSEEKERLAAALGQAQSVAGETGSALERDSAAAARLETTAERLHSIALVARERRLHLAQAAEDVRARLRSIEEQREELKSELTSTGSDEAKARAAADAAEASLRSLEAEERSLAQAAGLPPEGQAASLRGELAALEASEHRDTQESGDLARRRGAVMAVIEEEITETARLESELARSTTEMQAAQSDAETSADAAGRDRDSLSSAEATAYAADVALAEAAATLDVLRALHAHEATRREALSLPDVIDTLLARLDVPDALEHAVSAALGPWIGSLVVADADLLERVFAQARDEGRKGLAFVAPRNVDRALARDLSKNALLDLLGPGSDPALAGPLLGDVVLADGLAEALALVGREPGLRAVTREGELITVDGIAGAASSPRLELDVALTAVEEAEALAARARSRVAAARRDLAASGEREQEAHEALRAIESRIAGLDEALGLVTRSREERESELDRLDARSRALAEAAAGRKERIGDLKRRIAKLEGPGGGDFDDLAERRRALADERERARKVREAAAAELAAAETRRDFLQARIEDLSEEAPGPPDDPGRIEGLERIEDLAGKALVAVRRHVGVLHARREGLLASAGRTGAALEDAGRRREELNAEIEQARQSISDIAVEQAELSVREESVIEGLRREVDAEEDEALATSPPEWPDGADPEEHATALAARLRRMGPVNPLAAEEYRSLSERVEFVEGQVADLEESRSELRKVIAALDGEIGRLFRDAFDDIAAKFAENFEVLFPGGSGRLELSDEENLLDSGVEIHARPMGKKTVRLQLLSGGERSLAALAFLFAVFRSRPSPFYILDEVDAALDAANLRRFLRLLGTVRDTSQLVIVTHQQQTMEAADILYGVTMEPGASSRVVAKRLVAA